MLYLLSSLTWYQKVSWRPNVKVLFTKWIRQANLAFCLQFDELTFCLGKIYISACYEVSVQLHTYSHHLLISYFKDVSSLNILVWCHFAGSERRGGGGKKSLHIGYCYILKRRANFPWYMKKKFSQQRKQNWLFVVHCWRNQQKLKHTAIEYLK